jgi:hypothetical protein
MDRIDLERHPLPQYGGDGGLGSFLLAAPAQGRLAARCALYRRPSVVTLDGGYVGPPADGGKRAWQGRNEPPRTEIAPRSAPHERSRGERLSSAG